MSISYVNDSNASDFMAEIAVLLVLDIQLPASSRIPMQIQFVYSGPIRFLAVFY